MQGLWDCVINELSEEIIQKFCEDIKYKEYDKKYDKKYSDLEAILSKANLARSFIEKKSKIKTIHIKLRLVI